MKNNNHTNRSKSILLTLCLFFLYAANSFAQPFAERRIPVYFYAGLTYADIKTKAFFDANIPGVNSELSLEEDLGFSSRKVFPSIKIIPGGRFQFSGSFASLHRKGEAELKKQFAFGDSVYTVGSNIKGYLNADYFSLLLQYSIFHKAKFNAGFSLGLGYSILKAGVDATSYGLSYKKDVSLNVPVLLPGVHVNVYILPNTLIRTSAEFLSIKINDSNGKIRAAQVSIEQYIFKFLGAGVGYSINKIEAENLPKNDAFLSDLDFEAKGFSFFAALRF
jgi:hypothetical protein